MVIQMMGFGVFFLAVHTGLMLMEEAKVRHLAGDAFLTVVDEDEYLSEDTDDENYEY